jgi:hypothetical protein
MTVDLTSNDFYSLKFDGNEDEVTISVTGGISAGAERFWYSAWTTVTDLDYFHATFLNNQFNSTKAYALSDVMYTPIDETTTPSTLLGVVFAEVEPTRIRFGVRLQNPYGGLIATEATTITVSFVGYEDTI